MKYYILRGCMLTEPVVSVLYHVISCCTWHSTSLQAHTASRIHLPPLSFTTPCDAYLMIQGISTQMLCWIHVMDSHQQVNTHGADSQSSLFFSRQLRQTFPLSEFENLLLGCAGCLGLLMHTHQACLRHISLYTVSISKDSSTALGGAWTPPDALVTQVLGLNPPM